MTIEKLSQTILAILPQKPPFRFLDRIIAVDETSIVGEYTFKEDEYFYEGHFPGNKVTPGVIQIEAMAQTAVVAYGIYLLQQEDAGNPRDYLTVFTDVQAEFFKEVKPGAKVTIRGEKIFWRRRKLRCKAFLYLANGELAAEATLSGLGVKHGAS